MLIHKLFPHLRSLCFEGVSLDAGTVTFTAAVKRRYARCPLCQRQSTRIHSRYRRRVADLPMGGRSAMLLIQVRRFARGLSDDYEAVRDGLTLARSNGQTEGFVNKLKLTKRSMSGRGKVGLLRQRLLHAA